MIYSVRWQLLLSMVAVILVTVGMTAFFANQAANAEIERVQDRDDVARHLRLATLLSRNYVLDDGWSGAQDILEVAAEVTGERLLVADLRGNVVADSHRRVTGGQVGEGVPSRAVVPVVNSQGRLGILLLEPDLPQMEGAVGGLDGEPAQPSLSLLLILSGLLAVGVAMILTYFVSHRILAPIESLSRVSRLSARRDFSARAEVRYRDEVGEMARTFNSMLDELSRTEELRRNLVADVAHELRTPVTNIRGYIEGISDGVVQADGITLESIHSEIILLTRLIEDLQTLALAESGQIQLRRQPCDLSSLVSSAAHSILPQAQAKQVSLRVAPAPPLSIDADPQRISQVLSNLLANGIIHTPPGGSICVEVAPQDGQAVVLVRDTGPGIPEEELPHIFERFYRVDKSRSRSTGGVGLGLTITRHLVQAHGGAITASSPPGGGTEFVVTLPLAKREEVSLKIAVS